MKDFKTIEIKHIDANINPVTDCIGDAMTDAIVLALTENVIVKLTIGSICYLIDPMKVINRCLNKDSSGGVNE